jgi:hypothetical protein
MAEMTIKEDAKGNLTVTIPVKGVKGTPSSSGKTLVIGSTRGNTPITMKDGRQIVLSINCYEYANPR